MGVGKRRREEEREKEERGGEKEEKRGGERGEEEREERREGRREMGRRGEKACLECLKDSLRLGVWLEQGEQGREACVGGGKSMGDHEGAADYRGPFRLGLRI